jgi:hypothetical protein
VSRSSANIHDHNRFIRLCRALEPGLDTAQADVFRESERAALAAAARFSPSDRWCQAKDAIC